MIDWGTGITDFAILLANLALLLGALYAATLVMSFAFFHAKHIYDRKLVAMMQDYETNNRSED